MTRKIEVKVEVEEGCRLRYEYSYSRLLPRCGDHAANRGRDVRREIIRIGSGHLRVAQRIDMLGSPLYFYRKLTHHMKPPD